MGRCCNVAYARGRADEIDAERGERVVDAEAGCRRMNHSLPHVTVKASSGMVRNHDVSLDTATTPYGGGQCPDRVSPSLASRAKCGWRRSLRWAAVGWSAPS